MVVALACLVGGAIAASLGAFNGIGVAQHPPTGADVIDPATAAWMSGTNCGQPGSVHQVCQGIIRGLQLDTARHIGQLPDGQNIYVVTGTQNDLCTVVGPPNATWECGDPLSNAHPATIITYPAFINGAATRWVTFGVALDGVTSVSFPYSTQATEAAGGAPLGPGVTVPVTNNLWVYPSNDAEPPTVLQPVTAHFADGTTVTEPATGTNCAAC
jgi:hypothetical protein